MNLKSMRIDALIGLRNRIDTVLKSKVADERRVLESKLAKLTRYQSTGSRSKSMLRLGATTKVAPKYRNPNHPSETLAGRGLRPRWLAGAIKAGKRLEQFAIEKPVQTGAGKKRLTGLPGPPTIKHPKPRP
jgi:DNA-binding protein H-NS